MVFEEIVHGTHFAEDVLRESITDTTEWKNVETNELENFEKSICEIFSRFPITSNPNESQTEDDLIWPILHLLGWNSHLRQQNLSVRGMENVPDGLLFADDVAKNKATQLKDEWKRYQFGTAIVESKRWMRPFDHRMVRSLSGGKNYSLPNESGSSDASLSADDVWMISVRKGNIEQVERTIACQRQLRCFAICDVWMI